MRDPLLEQIDELQAVVDRLRSEARRRALGGASASSSEPAAQGVVHLIANWSHGDQEAQTICGITLSIWGEEAKRGTGDMTKVRGCSVCTEKTIAGFAAAIKDWERNHQKIADALGLPFGSACFTPSVTKRLSEERAAGRAEVRDLLWRAWAVLDTTRACVENHLRLCEFRRVQPGPWPDVLDARVSGGDGIKQAMEALAAEIPDLAERIKARDAAQEPDAAEPAKPDGAA